jgi:hypothetical protein
MPRKPIIETYQPQRPSGEAFTRAYVPSKPGNSSATTPPPQDAFVAKPVINKPRNTNQGSS